MRKSSLALLIALLTITAAYGCANQGSVDEKFITEGELSQFGIPGVDRIGGWYQFQRENVLVRAKINKVRLHQAFGAVLYFNEIIIIYPTDWKIRVIRTENEFYLVSADTKRGEKSVSFFINLIGPNIPSRDGQELRVERDRETKNIPVRFLPKNLYDQMTNSTQ